MNPFSLTYRLYKETNAVSPGAKTARVSLVRWSNPDSEDGCPHLYGWSFSDTEADKVPELDAAQYVGTFSVSGPFPYPILWLYPLPEDRDEPEIPEGYVPDEPDPNTRGIYFALRYVPGKPAPKGSSQDLFFVKSGGTDDTEWDLYSVSGQIPDMVYFKAAVLLDSGETVYQEYALPVQYPAKGAAPDFSLTTSVFRFSSGSASRIYVGTVTGNPLAVASIESVRYDSECPSGVCRFEFVKEDHAYNLYARMDGSESGFVSYDVPVYLKYTGTVDGAGTETRLVFHVHGLSTVLDSEASVKYVRNLASKVGTTEQVDILGTGFKAGMSVRIAFGSEWERVFSEDQVLVDREGRWDKISFVMTPEDAMQSPSGIEQCAAYSLNVGYGTAGSFIGLAGTGDAKTALENNVGLIRYKYDAGILDEERKASAGTMKTTNVPCFYTSDIDMVYDSTDSSGNPVQAGGAAGQYGKNIYWSVSDGVDCEKVRFVTVKLKYNKRLDYRRGEMVLDGVRLTDGDIVWLAAQLDGTDGLWVVRTGEWDGLGDYGEELSGNPCVDPKRSPLKVDEKVFVDLGARVGDSVKYRCADDVQYKYGSVELCGHVASPGDIVLLANQSDGMDGIWEVRCGEWLYRGPVDDGGTESFDASSFLMYQNDIDFCACRDGRRNPVFNIEYYYLNGGCYLAKAVRKVKLLCSLSGGIVPNNNVVITDYSITAGADSSLVVDTRRTAGDGTVEDCVRPRDDFELESGIRIAETERGCGESSNYLVAPDCTKICDCRRYYTIPGTLDANRLDRGFSIVFWQLGDGGWHLYAYVQKKDPGMRPAYYVYHLKVCGIATENMVDENTDVFLADENGLPTSRRTCDAWFVNHGGVLARGFGLFDRAWNFVVPVLDAEGNPVYDENGLQVTETTHDLSAATLGMRWAIHGAGSGNPEAATKMLAGRLPGGSPEIPVGMSGVYGFRFYDTPLTAARFCSIYNSANGGCVCQDTVTALATDQGYTGESGDTSGSFITTDGDALIVTDGRG